VHALNEGMSVSAQFKGRKGEWVWRGREEKKIRRGMSLGTGPHKQPDKRPEFAGRNYVVQFVVCFVGYFYVFFYFSYCSC